MNMKDLKFTPGPWYAVEYEDYWYIQNWNGHASDGYANLLIKNNCIHAEVNATLIAKAPEMFEALKQAKEALDVEELRYVLNQLQMLIETVGITALKPEWNRLSDLITKADEALATINKLGI